MVVNFRFSNFTSVKKSNKKIDMKNITELKNELLKNAELFNQLKSELSERQEKEFNSLVRLGDSKELALATTIQESDEEYKEKYHAYLNYHRD